MGHKIFKFEGEDNEITNQIDEYKSDGFIFIEVLYYKEAHNIPYPGRGIKGGHLDLDVQRVSGVMKCLMFK